MARITTSFSADMHDQTEKPGQLFPVSTQAIIRDRYERAALLAKGRSVVEIGGGAGLGLAYLSKVADHLSCLEYSQENIAFLEKIGLSNVEISQGDAHHTPYKDAQFDLVVALAMVYYLSFNEFVRESSRILKGDGTLFFCTSNKDVPGFVPSPYVTEYLSVPEIAKRLGEMGFAVKIEGAFVANHGGTFLSVIRSYVKSLVKMTILLHPKGQAIWQSMRQKTQGEHAPLPESIDKMLAYDGECNSLDATKVNRTHKVIYVTATKTDYDC